MPQSPRSHSQLRFQCAHQCTHPTCPEVNTDGLHNNGKQVCPPRPPLECGFRTPPPSLTRPVLSVHLAPSTSVQRVSAGSQLEQLADRRVPVQAREGERSCEPFFVFASLHPPRGGELQGGALSFTWQPTLDAGRSFAQWIAGQKVQIDQH